MSNTDLSDEAQRLNAHSELHTLSWLMGHERGWQECRRRAEILIEQERRKAFDAGRNPWVYPTYCAYEEIIKS